MANDAITALRAILATKQESDKIEAAEAASYGEVPTIGEPVYTLQCIDGDATVMIKGKPIRFIGGILETTNVELANTILTNWANVIQIFPATE